MKIGKFFYLFSEKGLWWFRICDYGIHAKNIKYYPLLFSERMKITKFLKIGNWVFKLLNKKNKW